ncbi:MAG: hypothetical protein AB1486_22860, partial [Planctomycetota bacterium]
MVIVKPNKVGGNMRSYPCPMSFVVRAGLGLVTCVALLSSGRAQAQPTDPCADRDITIGNGSVSLEPQGNPGFPSLDGPPDNINVINEGGIEFLSSLTPAIGATRDRHEISLQNGQLEF